MRRAQRIHTPCMQMRDEEDNSTSRLYILMIIVVLCLCWILQYFCFNSAGFLVHASGFLAFWRSKTNGGVKCMMDAMGTEVQNYNVLGDLDNSYVNHL